MATQGIDYSSRDYASILADLLDPRTGLAAKLIPQWTSRNPGDFGVVLAELFAYVGDQSHYYLDRVAEESFLGTATQRETVLRIARLYGYVPNGNVAAQAILSFNNTSTTAVTVPAGTRVSTVLDGSSPTSGSGVITFETLADVAVGPGGTSTVTGAQGVTVGPETLIASATGNPNETYTLFQTPVIDGSVRVLVNSQVWTYVPRLLNSLPSDQVFTIFRDAKGIVSVTFGDGSNGSLLPAGSAVTATYRVGGGGIGNVAASTLNRIASTIPGDTGGLKVTNPNGAYGGADEESTDSIRYNSARLLTTGGRATSLSDYAALAVNVPGVAKANATSSTDTSVTTYIAPQGGGGLDASNNPTTVLSKLMTTTSTYLDKLNPAHASLTVSPPVYVPIDITVTLHQLPQYSQSQGIQWAKNALADLLAFDNVVFGDTITQSDVHQALTAIDGVLYVDVQAIQRHDTPSPVTLAATMAANEIPVLGTLTVGAMGSLVP